MSLHYHPGNVNVVVDALSRLSMGSLSYVEERKREIVKNIYPLTNLRVRLLDSEDRGVVAHEIAKSSLCEEVKEKQAGDPILMKIKSDAGEKKVVVFEINGDGTLQ